MKIVHVCLSCFYNDGMAYQENELAEAHLKQGHDVAILASTMDRDDKREKIHKSPGTYVGTEGAPVTRLAYFPSKPVMVMEKLRIHRGVRAYLDREKPDLVVFHGIAGWELRTVARYCARNGITLKVDSHTDMNNSGRNAISRLLHRYYYRPIIHSVLDRIGTVHCVSVATIEFAERVYGIPPEQLKFFPLGGHVPSPETYAAARAEIRAQLGADEDEILLVHSGKFDPLKKTDEVIDAFLAQSWPGMRLVLAGQFRGEYCADKLPLLEGRDDISFIGWQSPDALAKLLCAADVYVQPGSQSATMQMALCSSCAILLDNVPSHEPYLDGNGWLNDADGALSDVFNDIAARKSDIATMQERSRALAERMLDYKILAEELMPSEAV